MFAKRFVPLFISSLALVGCGSTQSQAPIDLSTYLTQKVTWGKCPTDYYLPKEQQSKGFKNSKIECGSVTVPALYVEGHTLPDFKIAMMRQSALGNKKLGTLFINPGGPGESGVEELQWLDFPKEVAATYDIVGFDPRGVSHSAPASGNPIKCSTQDDFETYWTGEGSPENDEEYLAGIELMDKYYEHCNSDNPNWWTLSTSNVVEDLEVMRSVMTGDEPLNFLGSSYGTTIAASYITRFPAHVGRISLDSPTTNDPTSDAAAIADAKATEAHIMRFVKGYAKKHSMTVEEVKKLMLQVRQDGDDDKLTGFAGMKVLDSSNKIHQSTEGMFTHGIFALTYYDDKTAQEYFNQGLEDVSSNDRWNGLFEYVGLELDGYDPESLGGSTYNPSAIKRNNSYEILDIVNSMDIDFNDTKTPDERKQLSVKIKKVAPFWTALNSDSSKYEYEGKAESKDWTSIAKSDDQIPDPPTSKPARTNTSGKPVLVVGSRFESTTPYEFAVQTAKDLQSPLVTFKGTEHAPLAGFTHPCLNQIFVAYYVHGKLPAKSISCSD